MKVSPEKVRTIENLMTQKYPNWQSYSDQRILDDEINYKKEPINKAKELLPEEKFRSLLDEQKYADIIASLRKIASAGKGLLYLASPMTSDIAPLVIPHADPGEFCRHMYHFLFDEEPSPIRIDHFVEYLRSEKIPARWSFLTYYLFVYHPQTDIYCKPGPTKWFLNFMGVSGGLSYPPAGNIYSEVLETVKSLGEQLIHKTDDLIALHSIIYVAYDQSQNQLGFPFNEIFDSWEEANFTFDLFSQVLSIMGVLDSDDKRFAMTLPEVNKGRRCLRMDFGRTIPLDVERKPNSLPMVRLDLQGKFDSDPRFVGWQTRGISHTDENEYRFNLIDASDKTIQRYTIPLKLLMNLLEDAPDEIFDIPIKTRLTSHLEISGSPYRRFNVPQISVTLIEKQKREKLLHEGIKLPISIVPPDETISLFKARAFELLEGLHNTPKYAYYTENATDFKTFIERPFQELLTGVVEKLPDPIKDFMETQKDLFSRFFKNDYGKGGAWEFYWGALYPKGGKRTRDAQLALWINHERLDINFYIGEYGNETRNRFARNCANYAVVLPSILQELTRTRSILLAKDEDVHFQPDGIITSNESVTWNKWFQNPSVTNFTVKLPLSKNELVAMTKEDLVTIIHEVFVLFFPLILLAVSDDPLPAINKYLEIEQTIPVETNQVFSITQIAEKTCIRENELSRWVRAIERKKQAVIYGPPGTGKTFVAEWLAKHLISGGTGFYRIVQFHPEYSYEDFIQGIRPRPHPGGGLDYPMERGRFLDFCDQAAETKDPCVLIIDEINRANLARVFGELMYLLEYREQSIPLAGGGSFKIPANVRIIGTMNTADRSIALVDHALRRRFAFLALYPNYLVLEQFHFKHQTGFPVNRLIEELKKLNQQINDRHYEIGVSYFLREDLQTQIGDIWEMEIEPYLEEYFYGQDSKILSFRWSALAEKILEHD